MKITNDAVKEIKSYVLRNSYKEYIGRCIEFVEGSSPPYWTGDASRYETKTGKPVYYPNAYRRAWGKPIYVPATRRIEVGKKWIKQLEIDLIQLKLSKINGKIVDREFAEWRYNFEDYCATDYINIDDSNWRSR